MPTTHEFRLKAVCGFLVLAGLMGIPKAEAQTVSAALGQDVDISHRSGDIQAGVSSDGGVAAIANRNFSFTAFLEDGGVPINAQIVNLRMQAFSASVGGIAYGPAVDRAIASANVHNGVFSTQFDTDELGIPYDLSETYLQISACAGNGCVVQLLSPRQELTYAARAASSYELGGVARAEDMGAMMVSSSAPEGGTIKVSREISPGVDQLLQINAFSGGGLISATQTNATGTMSMRSTTQPGDHYTEWSVNDAQRWAELATGTASANAVSSVATSWLRLSLQNASSSTAATNARGQMEAAATGEPMDLVFQAFGLGNALTQLGINSTQRCVEISSSAELGNTAGISVPPSLVLRPEDGSISASHPSQSQSISMSSLSPGGGFTQMILSDASRSVTFLSPDAASNVAGGYTPSIRIGLNDSANAVNMSAFANNSPAAIQFSNGNNVSMSISPLGNAVFRGSDGVTAARVIIDTGVVAAAEGGIAGGPNPIVEFQTSPGQLELTVDGETVDRWTAAGATLFGMAPNRISGSKDNHIPAGFYGNGILSGGGQLSNDATLCPFPAPPCVDATNRILTGNFTVIAGGYANEAQSGSFIGGGADNRALGVNSAVVAGQLNEALGKESFVGGGFDHSASAWGATIGGGYGNEASGLRSTVAGGGGNRASADYSAVLGGEGGEATAVYSTAVGGWNSTASEAYSFVGGGSQNTASGAESSVVGGLQNIASGENAAIGGGGFNQAPAAFATIAGGGGNGPLAGNRVFDDNGTIAGGTGNLVGSDDADPGTSRYSTVAGGINNSAIGTRDFVGGGTNNTAHGDSSVVGGGSFNVANDSASVVAGGSNNTVAVGSSFGAIGGGYQNTVSGTGAVNAATVAGGANNTASKQSAAVGGGESNAATARASTVPGGLGNQAGGEFSFAAGRAAKVRDAVAVGGGDIDGDQGTFVWSDSTGTDFYSDGPDKFLVRASGGSTIYSNAGLTAGVTLAAGGGSWSSVSDRNLKENVAEIDKTELLEKLSAIPVTTWNYKSQDPAIRHIGPMGQDFFAAFGVGETDTRLSTIDADGVALAAIQGLHQLVQEKDCEIGDLRSQISVFKSEVSEISNLKSEIAELKALVRDLARQNEGGK